MKITKLLLGLCAVLLMASCSSNQYISYSLKNADNHGTVNQQAFTVNYDRFDITYTAEGGCTVRNNSDSMMVVDLGTSYFIADNGNSTCIFDSKVVETSNTSSHTSGYAYSNTRNRDRHDTHNSRRGRNSSTWTSGSSTTNTTTTTTVEKEERYVSIPPHASANLKFYRLQAPSPYLPGTKKFIEGERQYTETDGFLPCSHVLNYGYGNANTANYTMARNEFYITWQTVSNDDLALEGRNIQHNNVSNEAQTVWTCIISGVLLAGCVVLAVVLGE